MRLFWVLCFFSTYIFASAQAKGPPLTDKAQEEQNTKVQETEKDPKWFQCEDFSNCIKLTGSICGNAQAVNKKYQKEFLAYISEQKAKGQCPPLSDEQVLKDLKKFPGCQNNKCVLVHPK